MSGTKGIPGDYAGGNIAHELFPGQPADRVDLVRVRPGLLVNLDSVDGADLVFHGAIGHSGPVAEPRQDQIDPIWGQSEFGSEPPPYGAG